MHKARLIITFDCNRHCLGCCNTYSRIMQQLRSIDNLTDLLVYDCIMLTGGEPLLNPDRTLSILKQLRHLMPACTLYLYTATYSEKLEQMMSYLDGIQYSLHDVPHYGPTRRDIDDFQRFQQLALSHIDKSFRAYIDPNIGSLLTIIPRVWKRLEIKPWLSEEDLLRLNTTGLPEDEDLFVYSGDTR